MSPVPKAVLLAIADQATDDGTCELAISSIIRRTCLSDRSVQRAIIWLETVARVLKTSSKPGCKTTYHLTPDNFLPQTDVPGSESEQFTLDGVPASIKAADQRREDACEVLAFLNSKTGRTYRAGDANIDFIIARLQEGVTSAECRQVIAKKCREWGADPKMSEYLRPATLFNKTKFAQYLGELITQEEHAHAH